MYNKKQSAIQNKNKYFQILIDIFSKFNNIYRTLFEIHFLCSSILQKEKMIILEEPYVSDVLLEYLENSQKSVLNNKTASNALLAHPHLNIIDNEEAISAYHKNKKLYTISEYALDWVTENLKDDNLLHQITVSKDKALFRTACKTIYPDFYFKEIGYNELFNYDIENVPLPVVLKPSVGFLSAGVHTINTKEDWSKAIDDIKHHFQQTADSFPDSVVKDNRFILESYIKGKEYAIDVYFKGTDPVIINIFEHPFVSETDVKDRLYLSSKAIFEHNFPLFTEHIKQINKVLNLKDIPVHIEVRVENDKIIPIEINPLRFAGLCLNELHQHLSGKHPLEYYFSNTQPDYEQMWKDKEDETFAFAVFEKPENANQSSLDIKKLNSYFSEILEIRENYNPKLNIFAFVLFKTKDKNELNNILNIRVEDIMMSHQGQK